MGKKGISLVGMVLLLAACNSKRDVHQVGEFTAEDDRFWQVVPREAMLERIGIAFEFTEGPAWVI